MGRLIVSVVLLVLLTVLIVLNLAPTARINLFGARIDAVPVVAVAMVSFALGVVYSLFLYIAAFFNRSSRERLARKHRDIAERERKLAETHAGRGEAPAEAPPPAEEAEPKESLVARFLRLFR